MITAVALAFGGVAVADDISRAHRELADRYARQLTELADQRESSGDAAAAARIRSHVLPRGRDGMVICALDSGHTVRATDERPDLSDTEFWKLRRAQAQTLYELAATAADAGRAALTLMLLAEAVREDPDHARARRLLGYEQHEGRWYRQAALRRRRSGEVWHDRFGWLPQAHVARYENGERYERGRWLPADQAARLHSTISRGWQIETEHFEVTTNHSLEAGVQLAVRLERLYDVWWQVFAGYHVSRTDLKRMFQRQLPRRTTRRHKVVYFRDREQYNAALAKMQPGIERTLGIYFADVKTAYFFAGEQQDPGTLFHEATHQLFQESRPTRPVIALRENFWIVEGIACYMESLRLADGYATLGGPEAGRLAAARVRLLDDGFYVPFQEIVAYGSRQIQQHPRIRTLYSQAAGQATFLMHYDNGRYRGALSDYLQTVYRGAARSTTLATTTGTNYEQLDAQYRQFLQQSARR